MSYKSSKYLNNMQIDKVWYHSLQGIQLFTEFYIQKYARASVNLFYSVCVCARVVSMVHTLYLIFRWLISHRSRDENHP